MRNYLLDIVQAQKKGEAKGVFSVCSSNKYVLKAAMLQTIKEDSFLLVEPTANQVNQYGGYTGMKPADFVRFLSALAAEVGLSESKIILGGDHLGPNPWRKEQAEEAMDKSRELVRDYVKAGFTKIHLDTSIPCADDEIEPGKPMDDEIVARRAADLCRVAEDTYEKFNSDSPAPVYIIGTEVPIPGGAEGQLHDIKVTNVTSARKTLETTRKAFLAKGLENAWNRVIAQVVQPGVEFGNSEVVDYDPAKAVELSNFIKDWIGVIYEAHSTDYQTPSSLRNLVKDHFAILKVGPWLTFAFREAIFALSYIEEEMLSDRSVIELSHFREILDMTMMEDSDSWINYYEGDEARLKFLRKYSYSDRSRYYWQKEPVKSALKKLLINLRRNKIPLPLLSQFLPNQFNGVQQGRLENDPEDLILDKIQEVIAIYSKATGQCGRN